MIVSDTNWQPSLKNAGRAKYKALAQAIREGIVSGQLEEGSKLPPVRELAYQLSITPGTVARAYAVLTDEGRLTAGVGRGTFVAERKAVRRQITEAPRLLDPVLDLPERAHLLSPKMPEVGQAQILRDGMMHLATQMPPDQLLNYPTRETDLAAREACRAELMAAPVGPFTVDDIITSHGGQHAIVMILQTILHGPAPVVAVDELSYGGFRSAALLSRAQVVGVPSDEHGPIPEALEALIKTKGVQVFCTAAEVNNPTLVTTTLERREQIAKLAERYGVHLIDDDCYRLHGTPHIGPSYRALLPDLGWYVTSPSKSLTAALRIGFVLAPQDWTKSVARTSTFHSFGVTRLISDLYAYVMAHPDLDDVVERVRARIALDVRAAVNALGGHRLSWSEDVPFLLLELPIGWRASDFRQAAEKEGVLIKSAEDFGLRDGRTHQAVRIAVNGQSSHERFAEAMGSLRALLNSPPEQISV